jgi:hypothetical protein
MEVSGRLDAPTALPLGKGDPGTYWVGDWAVQRLWIRDIILVLLGIKRRFVCHPTHNLVTTLTELSSSGV